MSFDESRITKQMNFAATKFTSTNALFQDANRNVHNLAPKVYPAGAQFTPAFKHS